MTLFAIRVAFQVTLRDSCLLVVLDVRDPAHSTAGITATSRLCFVSLGQFETIEEVANMVNAKIMSGLHYRTASGAQYQPRTLKLLIPLALLRKVYHDDAAWGYPY